MQEEMNPEQDWATVEVTHITVSFRDHNSILYLHVVDIKKTWMIEQKQGHHHKQTNSQPMRGECMTQQPPWGEDSGGWAGAEQLGTDVCSSALHWTELWPKGCHKWERRSSNRFSFASYQTCQPWTFLGTIWAQGQMQICVKGRKNQD